MSIRTIRNIFWSEWKCLNCVIIWFQDALREKETEWERELKSLMDKSNPFEDQIEDASTQEPTLSCQKSKEDEDEEEAWL